MASEQDSPAAVSISFRALIFAPLIVVGLLVLLASWLAILSFFSWLSSKFQEYRARRRIDNALAPSKENDMVETRHVENGMWQLSWKTRQVANMGQVHSATGELKATPKTLGSLSILPSRDGPIG